MTPTERLMQLAVGIPEVTELSIEDRANKVARRKLITGGLAAASVGGGVALGVHHVRKTLRENREFAANAGPNDFKKISHDLYIDKHGAMYPGNHPRVISGNVC